MTRSSTWRILLTAWVLPIAPAAAAATVVVGPAPGRGVDFTSLSDAVNAAASGDTIVVLPGNYTAKGRTVLPGGKALTIVGSGADVTVVRTLTNAVFLPTTPDNVVIRGLRIVADDEGLGNAVSPLHLLWSVGSLLVEDCVLDATTTPGKVPKPAVYLESATNVAFARCTLLGSGGKDSSPFIDVADGATALFIAPNPGTTASVQLHDCEIRGGDGRDQLLGNGLSGGSGGDGLWARDAVVFASGCTFEGGDTRLGDIFGPNDDGTGVPGTGARLNSGATLLHQACAFTSGTDVQGTSPPPPPIVVLAGAAQVPVGGVPAILATSGKTAVGQQAGFQLVAAPGAAATLLLGPTASMVQVPGFLGFLALNPPAVTISLGTVAPSGTIAFNATIPPLPASVESLSVGVQALVLAPGSNALSNPSVFTAVIPGL